MIKAIIVFALSVGCGPSASEVKVPPPSPLTRTATDFEHCRDVLDAHVQTGEVAFFDKDLSEPACCEIFMGYLAEHHDACPSPSMDPPHPKTRMSIEACAWKQRGERTPAHPCS